MKHISKVLSLLLVVVFMASTLVGCSSDELSVFNAMLKQQSVSSMESKTDMSFKLAISGLPEDQQKQSESILQMVNNTKLSLNQRTIQDPTLTNAKAELQANINIAGLQMGMGIWVDTDLSSEKPVIKEIFSLPAIAKMSLPKELVNGRAFVPVRFLAQSLNGTITFDEVSSTVIITY